MNLQIFARVPPFDLGFLLVLAALLSASLILLLRPVLVRIALVTPNERSSHNKPTPQGGGLAVIIATLSITAATPLLSPAIGMDLASLWPVAAATALLTVTGAATDYIGPPAPKENASVSKATKPSLGVSQRLLLQAVAVSICLIATRGEPRIVPLVPYWFETAFIFVGMMWFINLVNFMDGVDWITVSEVVPVSIALVLSSLLIPLQPVVLVIAVTLLGATSAFAPFNRPIASIFLGDAGSLPIGFLLGWSLLELARAGYIAAALLLPLYYLADATITLLRRLANRERIWLPHRTHFYQRATNGRFSVIQIVSTLFCLNLVLAALALATIWRPSLVMDIAAGIVGGASVIAILVVFGRGIRWPANPRLAATVARFHSKE